MSESTQAPLRYAVVGAGAFIFSAHKIGLELPISELVGVSDIRPEAAAKNAESFGCPVFSDHKVMIEETKPDVVVIMTPHPSHASITIDALNAGCHVLVEKPMAVQVAEADAMIAAAEKSGKLLAVNFQQRLRPEIIKAKEIIDSGRLGIIQNVDIKITWTRSRLYYKSSNWRGTWNGEGGGVLLNQAPHELDLLCHLIGMPTRIIGWARTIAHNIETEDTIQAMMEWDSGTLGTLHISTAEAGQPQRFEIIGTKGHLRISNGKLELHLFEEDLIEFLTTTETLYSGPSFLPAELVELPSGEGKHYEIYQNLYAVINNNASLTADARSSARGLELANAILYSSQTREPIEFPLDRQKFGALLDDLKAKRTSLNGA